MMAASKTWPLDTKKGLETVAPSTSARSLVFQGLPARSGYAQHAGPLRIVHTHVAMLTIFMTKSESTHESRGCCQQKKIRLCDFDEKLGLEKYLPDRVSKQLFIFRNEIYMTSKIMRILLGHPIFCRQYFQEPFNSTFG